MIQFFEDNIVLISVVLMYSISMFVTIARTNAIKVERDMWKFRAERGYEIAAELREEIARRRTADVERLYRETRNRQEVHSPTREASILPSPLEFW